MQLTPQEKKDGIKIIQGNKYNRYNVCLDCNGQNPECLHNNMIQQGTKIVCAMCGLDFTGKV